MTEFQRRIVLGAFALAVVGVIYYLEIQKPPATSINTRPEDSEIPLASSEAATSTTSRVAADVRPRREEILAQKQKNYERVKEISTPDGFINADSSFTIKNLVGKKVILVDFWTYSCINCQRTIPYLNAWYEKYRDKGLEIVGIHTPEFDFEKKFENVEAAAKKFGIRYPIVLDNDFSTWHAYKNQFWPHKYLIDIDGFIVYDHIGEGEYDTTENKIQELLKERMTVLGERADIAGGTVKPQDAIAVDFNRVGSPEVYFGAARNKFLTNGMSGTEGTQTLFLPKKMSEPNELYLEGNWDFKKEFARNILSSAKILFRYKAKNVYFVANADSGVTIKVMQDGKPVGAVGGEDIKNDSFRVKDARSYHIISNPNYEEHTLELIIEDPGLEAHTFTFG